MLVSTDDLLPWSPVLEDSCLATFVDTLLNGHDGSTQDATHCAVASCAKDGVHVNSECNSALATSSACVPATVSTPSASATTSIVGKRDGTASQERCRHERKPSSRRRPRGYIQKTISNDTYLRRLYLSSKQAVTLFPFLREKLSLSSKPPSKRKPRSFANINFQCELLDADNRAWSAEFECEILFNGQLHCRMAGGWSQFCRDNGITVNDNIALERQDGGSANLFVTVETTGGKR